MKAQLFTSNVRPPHRGRPTIGALFIASAAGVLLLSTGCSILAPDIHIFWDEWFAQERAGRDIDSAYDDGSDGLTGPADTAWEQEDPPLEGAPSITGEWRAFYRRRDSTELYYPVFVHQDSGATLSAFLELSVNADQTCVATSRTEHRPPGEPVYRQSRDTPCTAEAEGDGIFFLDSPEPFSDFPFRCVLRNDLLECDGAGWKDVEIDYLR